MSLDMKALRSIVEALPPSIGIHPDPDEPGFRLLAGVTEAEAEAITEAIGWFPDLVAAVAKARVGASPSRVKRVWRWLTVVRVGVTSGSGCSHLFMILLLSGVIYLAVRLG